MYAIKTVSGYVAQNQMPPQSNRAITYTLERTSAHWYLTTGTAINAAKRYGLRLVDVEIQRDTD